MAGQVRDVNGRRWYVNITGHGEPVLLLHGFTGSADTWEWVSAELAGSYQCIAVDITGHGRSDKPTELSAYRMDTVVGDLLDLLTQLGYASFYCIGYSMGGRVALSLALAAPKRIRGLILESASPGLKTEQERAVRRENDDRQAQFIEQAGVPAFVQHWENIPLFATQRSLDAVTLAKQRQIRMGQSETGLAFSLRGMGTGAQPSNWDHLHRMERPVLLLTGALDEKFCRIAEEMAAHLPNARQTVVPRAGHTVHMEQKAAYIKAVRTFLESTGGHPHETGWADGRHRGSGGGMCRVWIRHSPYS